MTLTQQFITIGMVVLGTMLTLCFRSGIDRLVAWYLSLL